MDTPRWQHRDDVELLEQSRDFDTRVLQVRVATVNEDERSVEAVLSTDSAVQMYDWRAGEMIDEVLLGEAVELPRQMPLLAIHSRYSLDDVLGSVRDIRREEGGGINSIVGRLHFADGDEGADRAWAKVRQGHLTDVSVGYRVLEYTDVAKGATATVNGRKFTATDRRVRIATRWEIREASIVPIGADAKAKTRAQNNHSPNQGDTLMNKQLRKYLESLGLRAEAPEEEAWRFLAGLDTEQRTHAQQILLGVETPETRDDDSDDEDDSSRQDPPADPSMAARQAVEAERDRIRQIRELAGSDVPQEVVTRACDEGWDVNRASREFLRAVRENRQADEHQVPYHQSAFGGAPRTSISARSLAAGTLIGQGISDPTRHRMHSGRREATSADAITEQDAEMGQRLASMSSVDLFRECLRLDTGRYYPTVEDAFEAARAVGVSGGTLTYVFSTNVYAKLMEQWTLTPDSTLGWCDEEDVPNFLQQEDISVTAKARLEKLGRGDEAKHATYSDLHETYKIARYAKQFVVDEQDVIDDRLGAIMRIPGEMGEAARQLRPDLVYSLLLENPTMVQDSGAVFNATAVTTSGGHANLGTTALSSDGLKDAITAMVKQRLNRTTADPGHVIANLRPRFLIVPADLEWTARELTAAAALAKLFADSSDPFYAQLNLLAQEGMRVVVDDRIGAVGVRDPREADGATNASRTGTATNWFLTSGARKGLRVAYRRGTGRQPQMRSFTLDKGQWGMGWDINMDIGAVIPEWRTWYKSTGAGS